MVQISQFAGAGDVFRRTPGDVAILENIKGGIQNIQTRDLAGQLATPGISEDARQEALIRLQTINPQAAQGIEQTLLRGDNRMLAQQQKQADDAFKLATFFDTIKDPQLQKVAIRKEARRVQAGGDTDGALRLNDLANGTPSERRIAIQKQIITAGDTKTVTKFAQDQATQRQAENINTARTILGTPIQDQAVLLDQLAQKATREGKPAQADNFRRLMGMSSQKRNAALGAVIAKAGPGAPGAGFTLSPGQQRFDEQGRPIAGVPAAPTKQPAQFAPVFAADGTTITGQRNLATGEVKSDPRTIKDTTLIQTLKSIGVDVNTPEGATLVRNILTKPKVSVNINKENNGLFKTPQGFMLNDLNDPTKGVVPIPGGPKDNLTGENAGKAQMLRTAQNAAKDIDGLVFDKDGNVDSVNLVNAALNLPGSQGRELRQKMEFGIQAITRLETGAAMPQEELENTRTRFMPTPLDSDKIVKLKLEMFNDFIGGTLKLLDPTGRFNAERFQAELQDRESGKANDSQPKRKKFNPETGRLE